MTVTTLDDVAKAVAELASRVDALEKKRADKSASALHNRVEDICDYLYGTNVRPPLQERREELNNVPAVVKPSNEDD